MTHNDLIERVAQAMAIAENDYDGSELVWFPYIAYARAALAEVYAALREPTDGVVKACLLAAGISPAEADDHPLSMAVRHQYRTGIAASPLNPEN